MTIKSWQLEFYPVPADSVKPEDALGHSHQKWVGLRRSNLRRHFLRPVRWTGDIIVVGAVYCGEITFRVDSATCALCQIHVTESGRIDCEKCPLYAVRGAPCDRQNNRGDKSPYEEWTNYSNSEPMIHLIETAMKLQNWEKYSAG